MAVEAGVWEPSPESRGRGWRDCRRPLEALAHSERSDGVFIHHVVDAESRPYTLRARWCHDVPPIPFTRRWTDEQEMTWEVQKRRALSGLRPWLSRWTGVEADPAADARGGSCDRKRGDGVPGTPPELPDLQLALRKHGPDALRAVLSPPPALAAPI